MAAFGAPVRVMIVDDSAVIRAAMTRLLESDPGIRVVARAADGRSAVTALGREAVDVVLLDIEMPVLDGLATLPLLLRAAPEIRVVMASTLTTRGADVTLRALRLGATDYIAKPDAAAIASDEFRRELLGKIRLLCRRRAAATRVQAAPIALRAAPMHAERPALLAIGSSTGGPAALFALIERLGPPMPVPVVITQHMPVAFIPRLAAQLDQIGTLPCREARDGEMLRPGTVHIAPGDRHLVVAGRPGALQAVISAAPPENFCRPSVDVMLRTAAEACGGRVLVAMLTGMGQDGLRGTGAVIAAGGAAVAQDEASSVVWGMPGAIAQAGLCQAVLPLGQLPNAIRALLGPAARA